jgi:hypothetical protein
MELYRNVTIECDETADQATRDRDLEDFPEIVGHRCAGAGGGT